MNVGSLFAGIGGFDLGLERAGMRTVWQVEIDPFRRAVLAKHFPHAQRFADVREVGAHNLTPVDLICGGFPCQDISSAGAKVGIGGQRSGLWSEFARVICELRPRYVLVENVADFLSRGLGVVLGDLASLGYDAEWDCLPASAFGAPHRRDRVWLVAHSRSGGSRGVRHPDGTPQDPHTATGTERQATGKPGWWAVEPDMGRVADGVPHRVDRLSALGDALVPQIAEWIGRRVIVSEPRRYDSGSTEVGLAPPHIEVAPNDLTQRPAKRGSSE